MTDLQIERNRAFIRDLRANPRKAKSQMRDDHGGRCCLCVAYDTALKLGAKIRPISRFAEFPPEEILPFYGWKENSKGEPSPILATSLGHFAAHDLNDGTGGAKEMTHTEIADAFEATFPEIKPCSTTAK